MNKAAFKTKESTLQVFKHVIFNAGDAKAYEAMAQWAQANNETALYEAALHAQSHVDDTEVDFNRMCIGPYRLTVPPYESVWRSKGRVLNNRYSATVLYSYELVGLQIHQGFNELPDFFGNELEFMWYLAALMLAHEDLGHEPEVKELKAIQDRFWAEHLGHWAPSFLEAMRDDAQTEFWKLWATTLQAQLQDFYGSIALTDRLSGMETVVAMPESLKKVKK